MQPVAKLTRPSRARLVLFAFGDFAFNLYWQSVMLFLLFYYTDAIDLPIRIAATIYLIASVWDGIANFLAGMLIDRRSQTFRFGRLIAVGAVPLGLTFMLAYAPPLDRGWWGLALILVAHMVFRTAYAGINVPYLAMSARISPDLGDRSLVAGLRMMFGTAAAVIVALGTVRIGSLVTGTSGASAFLGAAAVFAAVGAIILAIVGTSYRDGIVPAPSAGGWGKALVALARNRAFVVLNLATMAMIIAVTVLGKSVLYYFKYLLNDPEAGQLALAAMGVVSGIAIPLWMLLGHRIGLRRLWLLATGGGMAGLLIFAVLEFDTTLAMQIFLIGMQVVIVGLNFVFWSLLPNTIEYGEQATGVHVEGAVFGVAALLQRIAIGIATAILGYSFASAGYVPNVRQTPETLEGMRLTAAVLPLGFLALSYVAMLFCPIGRKPAAAGEGAEALHDMAPV